MCSSITSNSNAMPWASSPTPRPSTCVGIFRCLDTKSTDSRLDTQMQWDEHKFMAVHTLNTKKNSMTFKGRWVHRAPYFIISASMLPLPFTILTGLFFWISLQDRPDLWRLFNNLWGLLVQDSYRQNALVTQSTESKHGRNKDGGIFIIYSHRESYLLCPAAIGWRH